MTRPTRAVRRRTFATELLNQGVASKLSLAFLGHAATTIIEQAYAQLTHHRVRMES
jgi:site-specific recombinase XerD